MDADGERWTLTEIAERYGRTPRSVRTHWLGYEDWPDMVGHRARADGGRGRLPAEYDAGEVTAFVGRHPELLPPPPVVYRGPLDAEVTLSAFAAAATHADGRPLDLTTAYQYRSRPGFPAPVGDGLYRAGAVLAYLNARPGSGNRLRGAARRATPPAPRA